MASHKAEFFDGPGNRFNREKVLIVEGQDDAYFFNTILLSINANPDLVGIVYMKGNDVDSMLTDLKNKSEFVNKTIKKIAFVLDSDSDAQRTCRRLQETFARHNFTITEPNNFFCCANDSVLVGYTLLPSPTESGDVECLCLRTVGDDFRLRWIKRLLTRIENHCGKYDHIHKREAAMYLACIPNNDTKGVGKSLADGIFDLNHESLQQIKEFTLSFIS